MVDELAVWLYDLKIAVVNQKRGRLSLAYTTDALDKYPSGSPLLSLSLALRRERYGHGVIRAFLDGLLPEGEARKAVAREFGVGRDDTYGLIRELGRDCAGALVIQHVGDPPPPSSTTVTAERLNDDEIAALVVNLRSAPLGAGGQVRISLAGVQEKLLLTRMPDGAWGRPVNGTPSTHILKPEIPRFPDTVENEAFCMRVAKHLDFAVANVETTTIGGRKIIVVERYDRVVHSDGSVDRIHQEDFCQAFGVSPDKKYEEDGGPSLARIAGILQTAAGPDSVEALLRAVTLNVLIGNGDAHAKNFSLLHHPSGALQLTPLYDLLSTLFYDDNQLAMYIDNVHRTNQVTADRIVNEATRWGMSKRRASEVITDILERVVDAVAAATTETVGLPAEIPALVASQLAQARSEFNNAITA